MKPTTTHYKELGQTRLALASFIALERIWRKESPYDRKQTTALEKAKVPFCTLATARG